MKKRNYLNKVYGNLYKKQLRGYCTYCGEPTNGMDHCPPISLLELFTPEALRKQAIPILLVSSCFDCNAKLGGKHLLTIDDRKHYIERVLVLEYERKATLWSEGEITEMSEMFQRMIRGRQALLGILHDRIRFAQGRRRRFDEELDSE